jgi:monoterpene epsilon-lactone hydrolase
MTVPVDHSQWQSRHSVHFEAVRSADRSPPVTTLRRMVMADRPEVETVGAVETAQLLVGLGARMGVAAAITPVTYPWITERSPVKALFEGFERRSVKELLTYAEGLETPQLRSIERLIDAAAGQVLPVPWKRRSVEIEAAQVGGVPGEWLRPTHGIRPDKVILYLHGGGYVAAGPRMFRGFVTRLTTTVHVEAFVPDYRLAPEFPYPAALDDAKICYEALLESHDPESIVIAGDSAGGGLTAALVAELLITKRPLPGAAIMFSPEVDLTLSEASVKLNAATDILPDKPDVESYLHGIDPRDEFVSPLFADFTGACPMFIAAGTAEMFRDQIEQFVDKLKADDVHVEFFEAIGMEHVFEIIAPRAEGTIETMERVSGFVDRTFD